ncbi:ubiquitin conjugating enzyme [Fusarium longipes]|uniref:Ubiquitin conjugating enzyme n=1 Tax=Fusarium longipes TaxID=694270 RepID=A0A395T427_9HYPO|nr:ubiquitin conjugating enzyme [Fusarium longipes]
MISETAMSLMRRDNMPKPNLSHELNQLPDWSFYVFMANFILFIPVLLLCQYTFEKVFPVLAIVEDEKPPAYAPLAVEPLANDDITKPSGTPVAPVAGQGKPVTSSFRATFGLLRSTGGFRAMYRGIFIHFVQAIALCLINTVLYHVTPYSFVIAHLISSLICAPLSTAWVHIVITPESQARWYSRIPSFKTTFLATWRPIIIFWAASQIVTLSGLGTLYVLDTDGREIPSLDGSDGGIFGIMILAIFLQIAIQIPAYVVLVRVQASLLPADADTIIPFDRSFNGRIEPVVVGGRGYATVRDAWSSFSKSAWRRIVMLEVKVIGVTIAAYFGLMVVVIPQIILLASLSGSSGDSNGDMKM